MSSPLHSTGLKMEMLEPFLTLQAAYNKESKTWRRLWLNNLLQKLSCQSVNGHTLRIQLEKC